MLSLAQEGWDSWLGDDETGQSRVTWCRRFYCNYYFHEKAAWETDLTTRDRKIARFHDLEESVVPVKLDVERVRLLDVGSCYNPFAAFAEAETFALDLAPAPGVS
jgi:hypothetical protein